MNKLIRKQLKQGKRSIGTWIGIGHPDVTDQAKEFLKRGFPFIGLGADDEFLCGGAAAALAGLGLKRL